MTMRTRVGLVLFVSSLCIVWVVGVSPLQAAPSALPPRPAVLTPSALPPRPVVLTSTPLPSEPPVGGYLELRIQAAPVGLWSIVQWQDRSGGWHDVEGWKGTLDEGNRKVWWVARAELGKGPFRWLAFDLNGKLLGTSKSFYLPHADQTVGIEITLVE